MDRVAEGEEIAIKPGASIQAALDEAPGEMLFVPEGDYEISEPIRIVEDDSGLFGPGRIIQENPGVPILTIVRADRVQLRDLTLTRAEGGEVSAPGLVAAECEDLALDNLRVLDNRAAASAINLERCRSSRVSNCLVRNYKRVSIDDRTASEDAGYAFRCIDGTGIQVEHCQGTSIVGNRVIETALMPTRETEERFGLGKFTKKNAVKGPLIGQRS